MTPFILRSLLMVSPSLPSYLVPYVGGDLTVESAVGHWPGLVSGKFDFHVHGNSEGFLGVP